MPCKADAIQNYLSGKKYAKLQRLQCVENEEVKKHLVQSHKKGREHQLFCLLTQRHLNNRHDHIMKHVEGKRFQRVLKRCKYGRSTGIVSIYMKS
ncbi:hypothetical protein FSP39_006838 [Pinctada imbricata]|uniref:Uncharacterized protein n=1 Tax=Pinctada imbricata TaxID=66713 RepID=A0AA88XKL1_PINIB|nr:hypothetical protein FSP39_006838 [Pinctada imbricata]